MDDLLQQLLGSELSSRGELLQRQSLGNIVHIFSHIRMTLHVEKMAVKVQSHQTVLISVQAGLSIALALHVWQFAVYVSDSHRLISTRTV